MKRKHTTTCQLAVSVSILLSLTVALPSEIFAVMPEVTYLGVVDSKEAEGQKVTLQTEQWFFGNSEVCDFILTGTAPSEDAWEGMKVGGYVEARCIGTPGDAPGAWIFLARLQSRDDPVITDAYGDPASTHSAWLDGLQVHYNNVPDCEQCPKVPPIPFTCPAESSNVTLDSDTYQVARGETARHEGESHEVQVTFNSGDTFPWPDCWEPDDVMGGPQLISDFTIHVRRADPVAFKRGDVDGNGAANLSDGIFALNHLFLGGQQPSCLDSADTDDNGAVEISDSVMLFGYLFLGGEPPAGPFVACGTDSTEDELTCSEFPPCE